jgi:hypothetical protein
MYTHRQRTPSTASLGRFEPLRVEHAALDVLDPEDALAEQGKYRPKGRILDALLWLAY